MSDWSSDVCSSDLERTFQQIQQVAGRAGRGQKPGRVLLQTHQPEAPVIEALVSGDSEGFYAAETESRRRHAMPPYGRLAGIIVSSEDQREAVAARMICAAAPRIEGLTVIGPAPAQIGRQSCRESGGHDVLSPGGRVS